MRFLIDAQLPLRLARWLTQVGHDARHTLDLTRPEMRERFAGMGLETIPQGPEDFDRFIRGEIGKWAVRIREAGIQPE